MKETFGEQSQVPLPDFLGGFRVEHYKFEILDRRRTPFAYRFEYNNSTMRW